MTGESDAIAGAGKHASFVTGRNSQGEAVRGTVLRLTRHRVVFEVYNPYALLRLSEALADFRLVIADRVAYAGRAVVTHLVNTGLVLVGEVALAEEGWREMDWDAGSGGPGRLRAEFTGLLDEWERTRRIAPEFKVAVADIQTWLHDLHRWLEQVELGVRALPFGRRLPVEREILDELAEPTATAFNDLMQRFETVAGDVPLEERPAYRSHAQRQLHPFMLCAPFVYRTFHKPLGYAGDYEMVDMMLREPYEGDSLFAKILHSWMVGQAPAIAHRNRITYLTERLVDETGRVAATGRVARVCNLGCGPAAEVRNFLAHEELSNEADLLLFDFDTETLAFAMRTLEETRARHHRHTALRFAVKSVQDILTSAAKGGVEKSALAFDFIYCAGLFDYLSNRTCRRLMDVFYEWLAPGGLLVATNVETSNPIRHWMEHLLEWHLFYRDRDQFISLAPSRAPRNACEVKADATGVNIFLEIRKQVDV
jgi:extracellular factor (EF) 3-hydroxypalmitic acid methyl ester biosynthesis protein